MYFAVAMRTTVFYLALLGLSCLSASDLPVPSRPGSSVSDILVTSHEIRTEANKVLNQAFDLMGRAFEMNEEALEAKIEMLSFKSETEKTLLETLTVMRTSAVSTAQNIAEIKNSITEMSDRLKRVEVTVAETQGNLLTVQERQKHMISEVRLISLYKMSDQTSQDGN